MKTRLSCLLVSAVAWTAASAAPAAAPVRATVHEESLVLPTYGFDDPDPVPCTGERRYPYCRFDGSSATSKPKAWRAVVLENDRVKVTMLPEIGGKVWGAIDKRTGREFIYFNHAVKFRNIAMRGPWCSGGIEFNFGILGHSPTTATPVDWWAANNPDGSASCFVSATEYVNRTTWQVEVRLLPGEEEFHTYVTWFNGSNLCQPYYQWMTAAYSARGNPQLYFPGTDYIGHEGDAHAWPVDAMGRDLSRYANNAFGPSKSYHVLNGDNGIFAIWWPEAGFGSVHRNAAYDKYGRKIWLWALSRAGGIWEDLLTDTDGQYVELQSGRVFNQPRGETYRTPFKHPTFMPGAVDVFHERWGVVRDAAALQAACTRTNVWRRPLAAPKGFRWDTVYGHYLRGEQAARERDDDLAEKELRLSLAQDPNFVPALTCLADLQARRGLYADVCELCDRALSVDTYDPAANYLQGLMAIEAREPFAARERLGLAAYSPAYRAPAYALIARSHLREGAWDEAVAAAERALQVSPLNRDALLARIVARRRAGRVAEAKALAHAALRAWPLFHAARYELQRLGVPLDFRRLVRNEQPEQTFIDLATWYETSGLETEALELLALARTSPVARVREFWIHYCAGRTNETSRALAAAVELPVTGCSPFRRESREPLLFAAAEGQHWKLNYLVSVYLTSHGQKDLAPIDGFTNATESAAFLFRARQKKGEERLADLYRALALEPASWRAYRDLALHFEETGDAARMRLAADGGLGCAPGNNTLQMLYAKSLVLLGQNREAVDYLETLKILPSEHKDNAHQIWADAWTALAREASRKGDETGAEAAEKRAAEYPENLGAGKPYPETEAPTESH